MYLQFDHIIYELRQEYSVQAFHVDQLTAVTSIELFPEDYDYSPHTLRQDAAYVISYRKLRKFDPNAPMPPLICAMEPDTQLDGVFFRGRTAALVICGSTEELLLTLAKRLYGYARHSSEVADITREFLACRSADELMQVGYRCLENPILVTDSTQRIIRYTDPTFVSDPRYREIIELEYLPAGHPAAETTFWVDTPDNNSMVLNEGISDLPSVMCKALCVGNRVIGYLHVMQFRRDFTPMDGSAVDIMGNLMAIELHRHPEMQSRSREKQLEHFLRTVLDENEYSAEHIRRQQASLGMKLDGYMYMAVALFRRRDLIPVVSFYDLGHMIAKELPNAVSILYHNSLVFLIRSDTEITDFDEQLRNVRPILEKYNMVLGISNRFFDIKLVRKNTFLARKSIQFGLRLQPSECVCCYKDYSIYYMIEFCMKNDERDTFCTPELIRLFDHTRDTGNDELLKTLRVYMKNDRNKTKTAEELFIHINTVKYRIGQLKNIMQVDLDNNENALKIMLSLKILEYTDNFRDYEPVIN